MLTVQFLIFPCDQRSTCNVCGISIKDTCNLKRHLKEMHSSTRILCPLVDCDFVAKRMYKLHQHWGKVHSHLRFPKMRDQNLYETTVSTISTAENPNDVRVLYLFMNFFNQELFLNYSTKNLKLPTNVKIAITKRKHYSLFIDIVRRSTKYDFKFISTELERICYNDLFLDHRWREGNEN